MMRAGLTTPVGVHGMDASTPRAGSRLGSGAAANAAPRWVGAAVVAALLVEAAVVFLRVRARVSAPFWYDEQWRAYHLSLSAGFWRELPHVNTAVAVGWVGIERASALAFGNNEWALRLPEVLALPAIGWPTWRVARHWVGVTASAIIAAAMVASGPLLPYAVQLKPYAIEALCRGAAAVAGGDRSGRPLDPDPDRHVRGDRAVHAGRHAAGVRGRPAAGGRPRSRAAVPRSRGAAPPGRPGGAGRRDGPG